MCAFVCLQVCTVGACLPVLSVTSVLRDCTSVYVCDGYLRAPVCAVSRARACICVCVRMRGRNEKQESHLLWCNDCAIWRQERFGVGAAGTSPGDLLAFLLSPSDRCVNSIISKGPE